MKYCLTLVLAIGLYAGAPAVAKSYAAPEAVQNAYELYNNKQYVQAYKLWLPQAVKGDATAQYAIGMMLMYGQGMKPRRREALQWFHQAAKQREVEAMRQLLWLYNAGQYVEKDEAQARLWATRLEEAGEVDGTKYLASADSESKDLAVLNRAIERHLSYVDKEPESYFEQYRLGLAYAHRSHFIEADKALAREWLTLAEKHSPEGFVRFPILGRYFIAGAADEKKDEVSAEDLKLAEQGDAVAQLRLANALREQKEYAQAYQWTKKAADQNNSRALRALGEAHESAMHCLSSTVRELQKEVPRAVIEPSKEWSQPHCLSSGLVKERVLAMSVTELLAQEDNEKQAAYTFFAQAAALNEPEALYKLYENELDSSGSCVWAGNVQPNCVQKLKGEVSAQNQRAFAYLLKAGELGQVSAPDALGAHYLAGDIVAQNLSESLRWYQKSADDGIRAGADLHVAQFYCKGLGVPRDDDLCRHYLREGKASLGDDIDSYAKDLGLTPYVHKFLSAPSSKRQR
ncbi:MAG: tetratricopeptide repeat protein [Formosimonas sp.]